MLIFLYHKRRGYPHFLDNLFFVYNHFSNGSIFISNA